MLSSKYLRIKSFLTKISRIDVLHRKLIVLAQMYVDIDKGFRFSYFPDENGEMDFLDTLHRHFKDEGKFVFFDVGAHIGTYTDMVVGRFTNYEGHLFDVTKDTYEKCVQRHGHDKKLTINNAALSDEIGEVEYRSYPDDPTRNGISGVGTEGEMDFELLTAPCMTGDHYCKENGIKRINLLKVDAEGYDLHVLRGFEQMLREGRIDVLQFEYNVKHSETHSMLGDYHAFLAQFGYEIGPLRQQGVPFRDFEFTQNGFENGPNYAACRPEYAGLLACFSADETPSLSLGRDADLLKMTEIIENSALRLSLDELLLDINRKKYSDAVIKDVLRRLCIAGLVEQHRSAHPHRMLLTLKRPRHYRMVELERERLGYWGKDKKAPRYSVCVCNYNMADTLGRALSSVLDQLDPKLYEMVVIDDGSSDESLDELEKLVGKYKNFRYIPLPRDPKRRLGETRNISIRAARGEYVLLHIDADDEWEPYLQDFVTLAHNVEKQVGRDIHLSGQQTGIGHRDMLLGFGPYSNIYRSEDRHLMMKLAKDNLLYFLDYRVYRTRMARPPKKRLIKTVWDDFSQMLFDMRQNEPNWPYIRHALMLPMYGKRFSLVSRMIRPVMILPVFLVSRFMKPIINPISRAALHDYHEANRGNYAEVMERLGGDPDMSFLSPEAQEIYSHEVKNIGFKGSH